MFDTFEEGYDGDSLDYQQLKQDNVNHKLTSIGNLRGFTSSMAAVPVDKKDRLRMMKDPTIAKRRMTYRKPSTLGKEQLQGCIDWLNLNRSNLPKELENEDCTSSGHTIVVNVGTVEDREADAAIADASREDDRVGLYFREGVDALSGRMTAWNNLTHKNATDKELRTLLIAAGYGTEAVQLYLGSIKAKSYRRYAAKQAKRFRWRGMQEYQGVTRAIEEQAKGLKLKPAKSRAKPLPSQERLNDLLSYDSEAGTLVWKVSRGRVKAGTAAHRADKNGVLRTKVDGDYFFSARVVWAMLNSDPENNTMTYADGDPSNLALSNLRLETTANSTQSSGVVVRERSSFNDKYRSQMMVNGKRLIVIGYFDHEQEAVDARRLFIETCKR